MTQDLPRRTRHLATSQTVNVIDQQARTVQVPCPTPDCPQAWNAAALIDGLECCGCGVTLGLEVIHDPSGIDVPPTTDASADVDVDPGGCPSCGGPSISGLCDVCRADAAEQAAADAGDRPADPGGDGRDA